MTISAYDPKLIHPLFPRACSVLTRSETEGAGGALFALVEIVLTTSDPDNYITLDGTYPVKQEVKRRQRLYSSWRRASFFRNRLFLFILTSW